MVVTSGVGDRLVPKWVLIQASITCRRKVLVPRVLTMARPPNPKHKNNPLRQLRGVLASSGRTHISQIELAQICGISANTIKKIEFASRRLNPGVLTKVAIATGASW